MPTPSPFVLLAASLVLVACASQTPAPAPAAAPTASGTAPTTTPRNDPLAAAPAASAPKAPAPTAATGGIRRVNGIRIAGKPIEAVTSEQIVAAVKAAGYEAKVNPPQPCGNVDQLNFAIRNDAVSAIVAVFRIIKPADDCSPTEVSDYLDTWRHMTEGDKATTVMVYDEAAPSLIVVNAMAKGGQAEAAKLVDAMLAPGS